MTSTRAVVIVVRDRHRMAYLDGYWFMLQHAVVCCMLVVLLSLTCTMHRHASWLHVDLMCCEACADRHGIQQGTCMQQLVCGSNESAVSYIMFKASADRPCRTAHGLHAPLVRGTSHPQASYITYDQKRPHARQNLGFRSGLLTPLGRCYASQSFLSTSLTLSLKQFNGLSINLNQCKQPRLRGIVPLFHC